MSNPRDVAPSHRYARRSLALAWLLGSAHSMAVTQEPVAGCTAIEGVFLVEGRIEERGLNAPRSIVYPLADRDPDIRGMAHHFRYRNDPASSTSTSVVFDARGVELLRRTSPSPFSCHRGEMEYEQDLQGGSEACSKSGHIKSSVGIGQDGALMFSAEERWEFGALCFAKPTLSYRTTSFPKYEGASK